MVAACVSLAASRVFGILELLWKRSDEEPFGNEDEYRAPVCYQRRMQRCVWVTLLSESAAMDIKFPALSRAVNESL